MLLIAAVVATWFLTRTRLGLHVYASGGNKSAARLAASTSRRSPSSPTASAVCAWGIAGLIATLAPDGSGSAATGLGNELFFSIAAAVVRRGEPVRRHGHGTGAMIGAS